MTKVYARFIGKHKSLGYQKGKRYHLNMVILSTGELEVSPEGNQPNSNEQVCVYSNLHTMLNNWQVLG